MYFHNDTPDPKSNNTETQVTYLDMYNEYTALKGKYKKECKRGLSGDEAKKELEDIQSFFRDNLDKGIGDLQLFYCSYDAFAFSNRKSVASSLKCF